MTLLSFSMISVGYFGRLEVLPQFKYLNIVVVNIILDDYIHLCMCSSN
jgi:hypothetical protein